MKKASKTVLTAVLAAALLVSATGCGKSKNTRSGEKKSTKISSEKKEKETEVNGTERLVARRAPDLVGHPDKGMLPKDMPSGRYTMVFVLPDGSVDSMVDFNLVQPDEAPEPVGID